MTLNPIPTPSPSCTSTPPRMRFASTCTPSRSRCGPWPSAPEKTPTPGDSSAWCTTSTTSAFPTQPTPPPRSIRPRVSDPRRAGIARASQRAILGHATYSGVPRDTPMARALFAVDELCGFLVACALVRPSRSLQDLEVSSVKKKLKDKAFARGVSREDVMQGAEELGVPLDEHIAFVLGGAPPARAGPRASERHERKRGRHRAADGRERDQSRGRRAADSGEPGRSADRRSRRLPSMLAVIGGASRWIHLENYIFRSDAVGRRFAEALAERARDGVHVRVLYDWLGLHQSPPRKFWRSCARPASRFAAFNPLRPLDHGRQLRPQSPQAPGGRRRWR